MIYRYWYGNCFMHVKVVAPDLVLWRFDTSPGWSQQRCSLQTFVQANALTPACSRRRAK